MNKINRGTSCHCVPLTNLTYEFSCLFVWSKILHYKHLNGFKLYFGYSSDLEHV